MKFKNKLESYLTKNFKGKKVLILGYGLEGQSTARFLLLNKVECEIAIADLNESLLHNDKVAIELSATIIKGDQYLANLDQFDVIIKSPGISLKGVCGNIVKSKITCQTDLFFAVYGKQTIGITGTKGKSTTSSLIYHILKHLNQRVLIGGNIGIPLFDIVDEINSNTIIVCETSSHQLEYTTHSPGIAILLNLFQEHLDHYNSFLDYQEAKYNIALYQDANDYFIFPENDDLVKHLIISKPAKGIKVPFGKSDINDQAFAITELEDSIYLKFNDSLQFLLPADFSSNLFGIHNRINSIIASAASVLKVLAMGQSLSNSPLCISEAISEFKPLEHRLELVGCFNGRTFINDSISTIPEATIAAVESVKPIDVLLLGGFDRGIDYSILRDFLKRGYVHNIVTTGPAGLVIFELLEELEEIDELFFFQKFDDALLKAIELTPISGKCLLSPAASSYNEFKNFEQRGKRFKEIVKQHCS